MDWKPAPRFYAAAPFTKLRTKRVGMPDSEYLPDDVEEFHAVKAITLVGQPQPLTKINVDDRVRAMCGKFVEVQYPLEFNPAEEGACKWCARKVEKDNRDRAKRQPFKYRTETTE